MLIGCGMKLRGDDPSAMKDFILTVQNRAIELKSPGSAPNDQLITNSKRVRILFLNNLIKSVSMFFLITYLAIS